MTTHRRSWQKREQAAAALFGARRNIGSGSLGRADRSRSDSTHERVFMEVKLRAACATRTLYEQVKVHARKEGKVPVLALASKRRPGLLLVVAAEDLAAVAAELAPKGADAPGLLARPTTFGLMDDEELSR